MTNDAIVLAAATGVSVHDIATTHGVSEDTVRAIIDTEAGKFMEGAAIRRAWLLEGRRLHELEMKFYAKAMAGDGNENAAMVAIRCSD